MGVFTFLGKKMYHVFDFYQLIYVRIYYGTHDDAISVAGSLSQFTFMVQKKDQKDRFSK